MIVSDKLKEKNLNKKEDLLWIFIESLLLVWTVVIIGMLMMNRGADNDASWLIATGRTIANSGIPKINPWINEKGLSVIVQQPLCALINYHFYLSGGGLNWMWLLAMFWNIVMIISLLITMIYLSRNVWFSLCFTSLFNVCAAVTGMVSTRPYQITTSVFLLLILVIAFTRQSIEKGFLGKTNLQKVIYLSALPVTVGILSLFMAWFQCASLLFIGMSIMGAGIYDLTWSYYKKKSVPLSYLLVYGLGLFCWICFSIMGPYGVNGALYLFKSIKCFSICNTITEMISPALISAPGILCILSIVLLTIKIMKLKCLQIEDLILICGILFTCLARRNYWILLIGFAICLSSIVAKKKDWKIKSFLTKKKIITLPKWAKEFLNVPGCTFLPKLWKMIVILSYSILLPVVFLSIFYLCNHKMSPVDNFVSVIAELPVDTVYTTFNSGGIVELAGKKVTFDARPELYYSPIAGKDLLTDAVKRDRDVQKGLEAANTYQYAVAYKGDRMCDAFLISSSWTNITPNECKDSNFILFTHSKKD